ncbi:hypothetical protein P3X46_021342 [Hevea brasiliensis]|uniref:Pentacotripeptide-repeat region of PRORP domain-containing protein n=1 Tax=Hevea brasiliensis TaxID=3981 RepID=A0ABQ9LF84_HEVBR|nr:pentatricopeptide repeat-containing protein At4g08210 [Hevea brasiliensis]XP_021656156.2 pentatricopeptide repeat-containing protein At4g08210 [Hevea brasiliensis]XP_021656165.2 pentatricopeptide repeat-containing protein At4g08210 [Hevea brasiliensis]XP_021656172.2 pentatricopeptide repeat-containing protein At4g08210 [Hevea brasiliensis]XP_021656180.2 pentatricopeptide repeat-containing protein At4g08210 [Hevea brasiliensis]XP_021656190.2 pentatricopeptide repeat-containing protein At4g08
MDLKHIAAAIRHCGRVQILKHGKSFHSRLIKTGYSHNVYMASNLISMYVDCSFLEDAHKMFDEMPDKNIVTWTTMVSAYTISGKPHEAIKLYIQMLDSKAEVPNGFMYSVVLKACGHVGDIELGKLIHKRISRENLDNDVVLMNALLDMYVKCGSLDEARNVFDGICLGANSITWNTIISGYCKEGLMKEAVHLFNRMPEPNAVSWNIIIAGFVDKRSFAALEFVCKMHHQGVKLDDFTFPCALKSCSYDCFLDMGRQIHCHLIKSGFASSCFSMSALVDMYSNCSQLNEAIKLFDQYSGGNGSISDSLVLWNSMLSGCVVNGQNMVALSMLAKIYLSGACIDSYTFSSALKVCINLLNLRLGIQVHGLVIISGYELDYAVGSVLVYLYAKLGNLKDAIGLFHRLPKKDIVAWYALIVGCAKMGLNSLGFSLFRDMVNLDLEVDQYVISYVLKICSSLASLGSGKQVHAFCIKNGYETEGVTVTALIDMYSKCGEIEDGITLFDSVLDKDIVCWTGIIVGCGQNGRSKEAVEFYKKMVQIGLKPNEVTFLGVLTACRHAGLIEEAWNIFKSMKFNYGLEPHIEHYYCMVELLGQAGCFNEAMKLIAEMPFKPDKTIWSSLLGACGTLGNTELVSTIEENLLATSPDDPSVYVMLSNAFAMLGMWDNLSKVRKAAKKLGIKKAGKSWIEISS